MLSLKIEEIVDSSILFLFSQIQLSFIKSFLTILLLE